MRQRFQIALNFNFLVTALFSVCAGSSARLSAEDIDYVRDARPILQKHCYSCHGEEKQKSSLRLDIKSAAFKGGEAYGPALIAGNVKESPLIQFVSDPDADLLMPPEGEGLSKAEIATLTNWVEKGAIWPDGVDLAILEDRLDHWSFKPIHNPSVPETQNREWPRNEIDRFILSRLENEGLTPSSETDRLTWLRRVYFDMTGLPPSPAQVEAFQQDTSQNAYKIVVDELLASPRYGERWGQHWLDVVRYADTHGFEVNTPRPNAWPYRDYVIAAFNNDTPYDQFIREQLAGDAHQQDAATGFLVTAAVLLPGQIGKDEPSIRLARQDALAEILINTGEAFLGLSIGCARCHDHKFDPISQRDYYSMQAFFSGVRYEERPIETPEAKQNREKANQWRTQVKQIDESLSRFQPLAQVGATRRTTDPRQNIETFDPLEAKFVRFTIHDANLHPSLGLIEPCLDEFEIFTAEETPRNVALATQGTKVTASGSNISAEHKLEHVNDGHYGNSKSWMSDEHGRGWVLFELPEPTRINKIIWGRDREGKLTDRLPTAYTLEAGESLNAMKQLAFVPPLRAAIEPEKNVDRFPPVTTQKLRFSIFETNNLEPCLDELDVFDLDGKNIALATSGTIATSSGNISPSDRHKLEHINDGKYGNGRSWISNETGRGWVELTFPEAATIDRVIWGRDREGKLRDRLPLKYTIEVADENGEWRLVADSNDRRPISDQRENQSSYSIVGLDEDEAREAEQLLAEKKSLEQKIKRASAQNMVFAGKFTKPDTTHLLFRGDPEQPRDEVVPAVLSSLGALELPPETVEQQRREKLADWIASPENPLTARVTVNRIWQWHFGYGLVETASDFGRNGTKPTHPELLDWLARKFINSDWSVKSLHRQIVLSATYRQSNQIDPAAQAKDADVRLLWRYPSRRLEAEAIRDSMLAVSGRLNLKAGGPGFDLFESRGGLTGFPPIESFGKEGHRRMIYAHKIRMEREVVFGAFDCPDAGQTTARRRQSTTPIQALNLFNSQFTFDESIALAERIQKTAGDDVTAQIITAYRIAFGRDPESFEIEDAEPVVNEFGLPTLCRAIYNSNEFLFLP